MFSLFCVIGYSLVGRSRGTNLRYMGLKGVDAHLASNTTYSINECAISQGKKTMASKVLTSLGLYTIALRAR